MNSTTLHPFRISLCVVLAIAASVCAQGPVAGRPRSTTAKNAADLDSTLGFAFDINDLVTNHQFPGQSNTIHVRYTYGRTLRGGGFDPTGHKVPTDDYPYFQLVRNDIIEFVTAYPSKKDFYELLAKNLAEHIMHKYPQIARLELSIDIPAFADIPTARSASITIVRKNGTH